MIVTGYIKLRKAIQIEGDCLNKSFEFTIDSIKGNFKTPKLPEKFEKDEKRLYRNLEQPVSNIRFREDFLEWGEIYSWPKGNSYVQNFIMEFEFQNEKEFANNISIIQKEIPEWIQRFTTNLYSSGFNIDLKTLTINDEIQDNFKFFYRNNSTQNVENALKGSPRNLSIIVRDPLSFDDLKMIIDATSNNQKLKLEYILLKDAQQALSEKTFRRSVLDSASAIEISLTNSLKDNLNLEDELLYEVLRMNNSISKKRNLLKYTNIKLPSHNYKKDLEEIRNRAIHAGRRPNEKEARKIFNIAKEIIPILSPEKFE